MSKPDSLPLISVVMPAYNHAAFMIDAVMSVLNQSHENLELIVVDDASVDDTWARLHQINDPRLRLFRHAVNLGAHATLNEALGLATGEYIAIINSDDVFSRDRLARCLDTLLDSQADLVGSDIELIDINGRVICDHWWNKAFESLKDIWFETKDWPSVLMAGNVFISTSNFFFRRAWLDTVGNFSDLRYVLDYEWILRGMHQGMRLAWVDDRLLQYRLHTYNTISEKPLAANLECSAMLRKALPELLGDNASSTMRLHCLANQWARIEGYIQEILATDRHEALVRKEAELFSLIKERDQWIASRDARITELERWVADRDGWVAERDGWVAERDGWIAERDGWIAERDHWINERDERIDEVASRLGECQASSLRIENSVSFRLGCLLTAPGRWLFRHFVNR